MGLFTSFQLKSRDAGHENARGACRSASRGKTSAIPRLAPLLDDPDWAVRQAAVESLGRIGDASAAPLLGRGHHGADRVPDPNGAAAVRAAAVEALGRIGAGAMPALLEALRERHVKLRETAIAALGAVGGPAAVGALGDMVADDRSSVRQAAIAALVRAGGRRPSPRSPGRSRTRTRRRAGARPTRWAPCASPRRSRRCRRRSPIRDRTVRDAAVRALAGIGTTEAASALVAGLHGETATCRRSSRRRLKSFEWTPADASAARRPRRRCTAASTRRRRTAPPRWRRSSPCWPTGTRRCGVARSRRSAGWPSLRRPAAIVAAFRDPEPSVRQAAARRPGRDRPGRRRHGGRRAAAIATTTVRGCRRAGALRHRRGRRGQRAPRHGWPSAPDPSRRRRTAGGGHARRPRRGAAGGRPPRCAAAARRRGGARRRVAPGRRPRPT